MADSSGPYDIVILGGGSGGYACALRAAELGKRVALIEKDKVGGTCLHRGCIPTKALLHAAEIADHAKEAEAFGVRATFDGIDMAGVNAYKDKVVNRLWKGLQSTIASRKVDIVYGDGRLVSPTAVRVGDTVYEGAPRGAGHRLGAAQPARAGHRRPAGDHQRPGAEAGPGARGRWSSWAAASSGWSSPASGGRSAPR